MFGDRPALSPPEIFYQRMLAGDPTEASEKAEEFLKERSLSSYYDEVALKGLQLAQADAERGALDLERLTKIRDAVSEFANNISEQDDRPLPKVNSDYRRGSNVCGRDAWLKMRLTKICQFSAKKICLLNGRANIPFFAWPGVVSSMKLLRSCSVSFRPRMV